MVWVSIIVALVMAVIGELLRPKPKFNDPKPSAVGDFSFPTVDASRVIPVFFGTCKHEGPNVTWFGDLKVVTLKKKVKTGWFSSKKIVQGYNYYLGAQLIFSYGPIDEFLEIRVDDKKISLVQSVFYIPPGGGFASAAAGLVYKTNWIAGPPSSRDFVGDVCSFWLYGPKILDNGDPPNGVVGQCRMYRGSFEQPPNLYLGHKWSEPDMSAFRPLFYMVLEQCYLGNSDTPPPISVIARRCPNQLGLTGGRHNVNGDSNIACAVYEVMTNKMWGMKIPEDKIDIDSFRDCGNILAEESIGISMLIQTALSGKDLVAEMLRHADGIVYADPITGLYTMTLAREIPEDEQEYLLVVDDSCIEKDTFDYSRSSWELTKNTIIVKYTDRATFSTKPVTYQELANIDVRGGTVDPEEFDYLGFSNSTAAMNTAARISKMKSSPLVSAKMSLNRIGYKLRPGSAFWLRKPNLGLANVLMRVIEISYGTLDDPSVKITAMEDIFAVNAVAYLPPGSGEWVPPVGPVIPFTQRRLWEAPAFGADDKSRRFVMTMAVAPTQSTTAYDVWSDTTGGDLLLLTNSVDTLTPSGTLVSSLSRTGPEVDTAGFTITALVGVDDIVEDESTNARENGENLLVIGNEIIAWQALVDNEDGTHTVTGTFRGVLDTQPEDHAVGARVYFISDGAGTTNEEGYAADVTVYAKLVPKSINDTVDIALVTLASEATNARALRPLPPSRLRINDATVGSSAAYSDDMNVTWAHRNRMDEDVPPRSAVSRTIEPGTTYSIRVYNSSNTLLIARLGISGSVSSAVVRLASSGSMRIEIEAVRDGYGSWTKLTGLFSYTAATGATANEIIVDEPSYILDGGGA